ncbi:MAG: Na+/H+ antiporter NhaA [Acidimicrobiaceae bacterium]|nr:Na+/H+ antiporter NhaA [Acidimicrobiaceae bacterium]
MVDNPPTLSSLKPATRERRFALALARPLRKFLKIQAAGGILLLGATVAALVWANSPFSDSYHRIFETMIVVDLGQVELLHVTVGEFVNDALMALFFFVVGLEIKREITVGALRERRAAALPAIAALGGMVCPALIYFAFNPSGAGVDGWGIPMATDIAFAVGVVSLLGDRVPSAMKVFLLSLAIVDDIGAIAVIAIFYTNSISSAWILASVASVVVVVAMRRAGIYWTPAYVMVGVFLWYAVHESGVHSTIAGVVLGLLTPAHPHIDIELSKDEVLRTLVGEPNPRTVRQANFELKEHISVVERLEDLLHPVSSYLIIPIFALANAGIELSTETVSNALTSSVTLGVAAGLVFGNIVGITAFTWLSVKSGLTSLPSGATWTHVVGLAATAGIGFTVSIFIAGLAFSDAQLTEAKIGIVGASVIAAVLGASILLRANQVEEVETDDPTLVGASAS